MIRITFTHAFDRKSFNPDHEVQMRRVFLRLFSTALVLFVTIVGQVSAGTITYAIVNYAADQNGATVSGSITTDGTIGTLSASDILSWNWTITQGTSAYTLSSSDLGTAVSLNNAVASETNITLSLPSQGQPTNYFALVGSDSGMSGDLEYDHYPGDNVYVGSTNTGTAFLNTNPVLNGAEPWIVANAAVPEPSTLTMIGIAAGSMLLFRRRIISSSPARQR